MYAPPELGDIPHERREVQGFTELQKALCLVYVPRRDRDDLKRILEWATKTGTRVTFRAGGHCFDDQALGYDLDDPSHPHVSVSMTGYSWIDVDERAETMTVGAGTTWGTIFDALEARGFVPYITVTTAHATAGGTLSGDCLSRFSPLYGKEGHHVEHFDVMLVDGTTLRCHRPRHANPPTTLEERLFYGVVGGFGYLGVITQITYKLKRTGATNGKIGVESKVFKFETFKDLTTQLVPLARKLHERRKDATLHPDAPESIFSALYSRGRTQRAMLLHSKYTTSPDRIPMPQHDKVGLARILVEWLLRVRALTSIMWAYFFWLLKENKRYVDDLQGFTFLMDGNVRAKDIAESFGFPMKAMQQTFIIPVHSDKGEFADADVRLLDFLDAGEKLFESKGVEPTLFDVLYIPADEHFLLSASNGLAGFAVSYAFETSNTKRLETIADCLFDLSETCFQIGGRVHLVKNVRTKTSLLGKMYAGTLPAFRALKKDVDPKGLLRNAFLERTLGI
jgi:decaprenylphospho-beta-D-ribofuranose 2-oxidase